jgi:periplasmic protein CpxP/Spy
MSETNTPDDASSGRGRARRRWGRIALFGLAGAIAAGVGAKAFAQHHGWHGGPWMMHAHMGGPGGFDPERAKAFGAERLKRLLADVAASEQQTAQIQKIMGSAFDDLAAIGKERRDLRGQIADILARPTIDRRAVEQARQAQMQLADRASQRMTQAMADSAEVLDPQQRQKLAERLKQGPRGHGPRGGPRGGQPPQQGFNPSDLAS